jgi:predicted transcriptional regulator
MISTVSLIWFCLVYLAATSLTSKIIPCEEQLLPKVSNEPVEPPYESLATFYENLSDAGKAFYDLCFKISETIEANASYFVSGDDFEVIDKFHRDDIFEFIRIIKVFNIRKLTLLISLILTSFSYADFRNIAQGFVQAEGNEYQKITKEIFSNFHPFIKKFLENPFLNPTDLAKKEKSLNQRKDLLRIMLSILQQTDCSQFVIVVSKTKISTHFYLRIMNRYIDGIKVNFLIGAEETNYQLVKLAKRYARKLPTAEWHLEKVLTPLLLWLFYSHHIVKYERADISVECLKPLFLAQLVVARYSGNYKEAFSSFNNERVVFKAIWIIYYFKLEDLPSKIIDSSKDGDISAITKLINTKSKSSWLLEAYRKLLRFQYAKTCLKVPNRPKEPIDESFVTFYDNLSASGKAFYKLFSTVYESIKKDSSYCILFNDFASLKGFYFSNTLEYVRIMKTSNERRKILFYSRIVTVDWLEDLQAEAKVIFDSKQKPNSKIIQQIFHDFSRLIGDQFNRPFPGFSIEEKEQKLKRGKEISNILVSILHTVSCSSFEVDLKFPRENISTESYGKIMTGFIERTVVDCLAGARDVHFQLTQLGKRCLGNIPKDKRARENVLTLLVLWRFYARQIVLYEYENIAVEDLDPIFLAQLTLGESAKYLEEIFTFFPGDHVVPDALIRLYQNHFTLFPKDIILPTQIDEIGRVENLLRTKEDWKENISWLLQVHVKLLRSSERQKNTYVLKKSAEN